MYISIQRRYTYIYTIPMYLFKSIYVIYTHNEIYRYIVYIYIKYISIFVCRYLSTCVTYKYRYIF